MGMQLTFTEKRTQIKHSDAYHRVAEITSDIDQKICSIRVKIYSSKEKSGIGDEFLDGIFICDSEDYDTYFSGDAKKDATLKDKAYAFLKESTKYAHIFDYSKSIEV